MFRRSRLSIRPNVGITGRTAGVPQEAPSSNKDSANANTQAETPVSVTDIKSAEAPNEPTQGDSNDQHGEAACSSAIQRRKRFSVKPKVVPGRPSALPRTPKSPIKPVLPPVKSPAPVTDKAASSIEANSTAPLQEILSPKECRLSKADIVSPAEGSSKDVQLPVDKIQPCSQVKEIPPKAPVPPSIPDRETIEISEKAKTLVSKTDLTTSSEQFSLSQLLNDKYDLVRLEKARKLRQLLKEEMLKVKSKKSKARAKEHTSTLDPSKMTMRDLIHYLPTSNPMSSTLEESQKENETVIPQSPEREPSPERAQEPEVQPKIFSPSQGETTAAASAAGEQEDEDEEAAEDEDALMVPQVKVAEDGTLIIDEESLTVEVQRMKGPNTIQDRDPIFERGSTTTYSSFRKGTHTKPWSTEETDMFFLAISMVGTDFTMICQLFPHRARTEIKNKFKKEERHNAWRIDKAFRERRKLDLEYFKKLLEKILEFQQSKKKLKSISEKDKTPKKRKRKTKGKKAASHLSDVEEEIEEEMSNEEQEGEKENLCNEETSASKPKRKRKEKVDLPPDPQVDKKKRKKKNVPDSEEAVLPEDQCEKVETPESTKKTEANSGKPGKAVHPLGCKGQKAPKSKATVSDKGESTSEETVEGQINKDSCSSQKSTKRMSDNDSSDQEITVLAAKPTRSGRVSKRVQLLNYPVKEDKNSSASDTTLTSPARKTTAAAKAKGKTSRKRGRAAQQQLAKESKKPKLITLRASQSDEDSDDEEEGLESLHYDDENGTSAFVPASLCSPKPVVQEVEETMEELDFLTHMPDVLGMSKNALCPDASCEQAQNEMGTVEPCEHQLDLLVDVIDFLSEHAETSGDEGYNEAAQTLLAIGNLTNLSQPTESQDSMSDHTSNIESSQYTEVVDTSKSSLQLEQCEGSSTVQLPTPHTSDTQAKQLSEESYSIQEKSSTPRKGRFTKIKPKPNLGSRATKLRTHTVCADIETKPFELEAATTSQPQSSEQLGPTQVVFEPSQTEGRPTVIPSSDISNTNVSLDRCGMSPKLMSTPEMTSFSLTEEKINSATKETKYDLSTTKETVEAVQEKAQVYGDITTTSELRSSENQEKSTLHVSEQTNTKNETVSTTNEMPASQPSDTQAIKPSDESCSSQETTATSQSATPSAINLSNLSVPRKGRLSRIKPKPNIGSASRTTKLPLKSGVSIEDKMQIQCEIAATSSALQSAALSVSESVAESCGDGQQESLTINSQGTESDLILETSRSQEQMESASQSTLETRLEHLQEKHGTPFVQCEVKPQDQLKPVQSITTIESGNLDSTQIDHSSEEEKNANSRPVQQSHSSLESSKLGSPQRRRLAPKVKPKLVLSPRTMKSKLEANEKSHMTDKLVKSSSVAATSEQQTTQENTSTISHEFKSANADPSSTSSVSSNLEISMDTQQASSGLNTDTTNIASSSVSGLKTRSTEKTETETIFEDPTIVGQPEESSATNQTKMEHCQLMECGLFDSDKTVHQPQDITLNSTGICQESRSSNIHLETSSPVDGAEEFSSKLQQNEAANVPPSGPGKVQDSSVQNMFECQNLFQSLLPDQVPSDPDEPFFILSLTEIPVCPSGEVVDSGSCLPLSVMEAQQSRHPVESVVPPAAEIDISLSNIHIPTPEKAALGSGLICVEEYLPSAPSVDISILTEPQENPSVRRLTLSEAQDNSNSNTIDTLSTGSQTPVRGSVVTKTNRQQNLSCKAAVEEANKQTKHTDASQDHGKTSTHVESSKEMVENIDSKSQKESGCSSITNKGKSAETRGSKPQIRKTKATREPLWEQAETQSSGLPTSEILACSSSSNKNRSTCVLSEPLNLHQSDTTDLEEEPTKISECFFSDVFTKVEEIPGDTDKTQSKPVATTRKQRQTKTSSKPPCGQNDSLTEKQSTEATAAVNEASFSSSLQENPTASSAPATTIDSIQQHDKKTKIKGNPNTQNKVLNEATVDDSQQQRKSTAVNSPKALFRDHLKESTSSSCTVPDSTHESCQQSSLRSTSASDSIESCTLEDEPTDVSQLFISDIFTGVESDDCTVIGKSNNKAARTGKSQTTQTIRNKRQKSKVKASNDSSSGQLMEERHPEVSVKEATFSCGSVKTSTFSVTETTSEPGQADAKKKERGTGAKGCSNKKKEASCEGLKSQRKCKEASKSPQMVSLDTLKETPSTSFMAQSQDQQRSLRGASGFPMSKNDSTESNEEPTNVSQYLVVDAFTEVECGNCSVTEKSNKDDVCTEKTQTLTSETTGKTRQQRKTKASSGPPCSQRNALTEEQKFLKSADLNQSDTEKPQLKEQSNKNNKSSTADSRGSRPQRQCTAGLKSPETLPTERIKENPPTRSDMEQPQLPALQSDSKESSDDEPTNVSQYFLSDVFTEVDEEFKT